MTSFVCIDNFLPYPNVVRSWALQQNYYDDKEMTKSTNELNTWPGIRTNLIHTLDRQYADIILGRIHSLCSLHFHTSENLEIKSSFQILNKNDSNSWIHKDDNVNFAGVLYLTPNPEKYSGTSFYNENEELTDTIENLYNRLILYRSNIKHKSTGYFGDSKESSRLTQVFFIRENQ